MEIKFRVGDYMKKVGDSKIWHIISISPDRYNLENGFFLLFENEDDYELVDSLESQIERIRNEIYEES